MGMPAWLPATGDMAGAALVEGAFGVGGAAVG